MKIYKLELIVWALFAIALVVGAVTIVSLTHNLWGVVIILFAFIWDFDDVKRVRDAELRIEEAKVKKVL